MGRLLGDAGVPGADDFGSGLGKGVKTGEDQA